MQQPAAKPRPVLVHWVDAVHSFGWQEGLDPPRRVSRVRTLGWLLAEDDECLVVGQSVAEDSHAQTIEIPRGMIRKVLFGAQILAEPDLALVEAA